MAGGLLACSCSQGASKPSASPAAQMASTTPAKPSAGCATSPGSKELTLAREDLTVSGTKRWYLISTPRSDTKPLPLVLDFHGLGEGAQVEALTTQFGPLGQKDGFISVFPEGTGTPIQWDTTSVTHNADLQFVSEMLDQIEADQCVDETRIFATGLSDGAFMTSFLASRDVEPDRSVRTGVGGAARQSL